MNPVEVAYYEENGEWKHIEAQEVEEDDTETQDEPEEPRIPRLEQEIEALMAETKDYFATFQDRLAKILAEVKEEAVIVGEARDTVLDAVEKLRGVRRPDVALAPVPPPKRRGRPPKNATTPNTLKTGTQRRGQILNPETDGRLSPANRARILAEREAAARAQ